MGVQSDNATPQTWCGRISSTKPTFNFCDLENSWIGSRIFTKDTFEPNLVYSCVRETIFCLLRWLHLFTKVCPSLSLSCFFVDHIEPGGQAGLENYFTVKGSAVILHSSVGATAKPLWVPLQSCILCLTFQSISIGVAQPFGDELWSEL